MRLICICGYKYKRDDWGRDNNGNIKYYPDAGEEKFIRSELKITINKKQGEWDCDRISIKEVYICPKCGTLKIDLN